MDACQLVPIIFSLTIPYLNSCSFGNQLAISGNEDMKILEKYEGVIWNLIFFFTIINGLSNQMITTGHVLHYYLLSFN